MCGSAMPCVNRAAINPDEPPERMISSVTMIESSRSPPLPPTDSGKPMPSSPTFAAVSCSDRGTSPARSQPARCGSTSRVTKARVSSRSWRRSGMSTMVMPAPPG